MKSNLITIVIIVIILILVGFITLREGDGFRVGLGEPEDLVVRLGWVHQGQFAGFYVAKELGFYDKENLNVEFLPLDKDVNQETELDDGGVDISIMEAHQILSGINSGYNLMAVAAIYQVNPHVLAAKASSGIESPDDFEGKTIGLSGGIGEGSAIFSVFLDGLGIKDKVKVVPLGFDTVDDFLNNRADIIDVYRIDQPYLAKQKGIPLNLIPLDAYGFDTYGDVVAIKKNTLIEKNNVIKRFVRASLEGWDYALKNINQAVDITLFYTEGNYDDRNYQKHIIRESIPLVRGSRNEPLGRMDFVPWSTLYESMRQSGTIDIEIDVRDVYTNDLI